MLVDPTVSGGDALLQGVCEQTAAVQCRLDSSAEASGSGFEGRTPCTTCICISRQTATQAMLANGDLVLVSRNHPRYGLYASTKINVAQAVVTLCLQLFRHPPGAYDIQWLFRYAKHCLSAINTTVLSL